MVWQGCKSYDLLEMRREDAMRRTDRALSADGAQLHATDTDLFAASAVRSLARLSRSMLHDLKAPLNVMLLNVELLKALDPGAGAASKTHAQRQRALDVLADAVGRLNRALEDLFARAFAQAPQGQLFDLREVITHIEVLVRPQATLEHVALHVELPSEAVQLRGDRTRVEQAILNIVINALDAVSSNGRVSIHVQAIEGRATITVMDTGGGIPAHLLEKLGAVRFSTKHGGTGIGLYVARTVVGAHGGELAIASTLGTGTTVRLTLPQN